MAIVPPGPGPTKKQDARLDELNAGARATICKGLFADFRIEYRHDSTPDARYWRESRGPN